MRMVVSKLTEGDDVLRRRLAGDGFLFFRGVIDGEVIRQLQLAARRAATASRLRTAGDLGYAIGKSVHKLRSSVEFRRAQKAPSLRPILRAIGAGAPHPMSHANYARFVPPGEDAGTMPAHQDHHYVKSIRFITLWVPILMPRLSGGIAIAAGSHTSGPVEHVSGRVAISPTTWHVSEYACGDVVALDEFTIHKSLPNRSESVRVSVDFRYLLTRCRRSGGT